eukprot:200535_1
MLPTQNTSIHSISSVCLLNTTLQQLYLLQTSSRQHENTIQSSNVIVSIMSIHQCLLVLDQFETREKLHGEVIQFFDCLSTHQTKNTLDDIHFIQQNSIYFQYIIIQSSTHHLTSNIISFSLFKLPRWLFALSLLILFYYTLFYVSMYGMLRFISNGCL